MLLLPIDFQFMEVDLIYKVTAWKFESFRYLKIHKKGQEMKTSTDVTWRENDLTLYTCKENFMMCTELSFFLLDNIPHFQEMPCHIIAPFIYDEGNLGMIWTELICSNFIIVRLLTKQMLAQHIPLRLYMATLSLAASICLHRTTLGVLWYHSWTATCVVSLRLLNLCTKWYTVLHAVLCL